MSEKQDLWQQHLDRSRPDMIAKLERVINGGSKPLKEMSTPESAVLRETISTIAALDPEGRREQLCRWLADPETGVFDEQIILRQEYYGSSLSYADSLLRNSGVETSGKLPLIIASAIKAELESDN